MQKPPNCSPAALNELAENLVDIGDEWREFASPAARMIRDRDPGPGGAGRQAAPIASARRRSSSTCAALPDLAIDGFRTAIAMPPASAASRFPCHPARGVYGLPAERAGKTTLISLLAGLLSTANGRFHWIASRCRSRAPNSRAIALGAGLRLYPMLDVGENLRSWRRPRPERGQLKAQIDSASLSPVSNKSSTRRRTAVRRLAGASPWPSACSASPPTAAIDETVASIRSRATSCSTRSPRCPPPARR